MTHPHRTKERMCGSKIPHRTLDAAWEHIRHLKDFSLQPYHCPFCKSYHVGHPPRRPK